MKAAHLIVFISMLFLGCIPEDEQNTKNNALESEATTLHNNVITGTLDFAQSSNLTRVSRIVIQLDDVSLADAPSVEISQATLTDINNIPITFELS